MLPTSCPAPQWAALHSEVTHLDCGSKWSGVRLELKSTLEDAPKCRLPILELYFNPACEEVVQSKIGGSETNIVLAAF